MSGDIRAFLMAGFVIDIEKVPPDFREPLGCIDGRPGDTRWRRALRLAVHAAIPIKRASAVSKCYIFIHLSPF